MSYEGLRSRVTVSAVALSFVCLGLAVACQSAPSATAIPVVQPAAEPAPRPEQSLLTAPSARSIDSPAPSASSSPANPTPLSAPTTLAECITTAEARRFYDQRRCVRGTVVQAVYRRDVRGSPTFIDLTDNFSVVVWGSERAAFQPPPEVQFPRGTVIEVTGNIQEFRGAPEIIVREPSQIRAVR